MGSKSILLVGIGGYGIKYVNYFLDQVEEAEAKIRGVVDPNPEACDRLEEIKEKGIPIFSNIKEYFNEYSADLTVISSPIQFHKEQTVYALKHGSNVLCEKPMTASEQDGYEIIRTKKEKNRFVGIGYQWSYSEAIQELKQDILAGKLGKPVRCKTLVYMSRDFAYFNRNNWAGKIKDSEGHLILDSVANNAAAHFLHNMFYLLGDKIDTSGFPAQLQAELYKANQVETFDTVATRIHTKKDVELLFYATHAVTEDYGPVFELEFENATVYYKGVNKKGDIIVKYNDGEEKNYGNPFDDVLKKIKFALKSLNGEEKIVCGAEAALPHVLAIKGLHASVRSVNKFPSGLLKRMTSNSGKEIGIYVEGLDDTLKECYNDWSLPSEAGEIWAKAGNKVKID